MIINRLSQAKTNPRNIIRDTIKERLGIHMPSFKKGVYKDVEFDTRPLGHFRVISSLLRWYRHYSPGDIVKFTISLRSLKNQSGGFVIRYLIDGKDPKDVINIAYTPKNETTTLPLLNLPGYGTVEYRMSAFNDENYVVIAALKATHNEVIMSIVLTLFASFIFMIVAWLLGFIQIVPFWKLWIP
jgi:hypothetical protein